MHSTLLILLPLFTPALAVPTPDINTKRQEANPLEKSYCYKPFNIPACLTAQYDARSALLTAQEQYPGPEISDGPGDAFRHCYWNALMTLHLGADRAKLFGDMHEDGAVVQDPARKAMDLSNNASGRAIAAGKPNVDESEWDVLSACDDAARAGKLVTICGGQGQKVCGEE